MHGRPRPPKDQPEDPEKQKAASKRVRHPARLTRLSLSIVVHCVLFYLCFATQYGLLVLTQLVHMGMQLALFSRLCNEVLSRRAAKRYDGESLALAAALLEQNPEVYTAWNFRREALQTALEVCSLLPSCCLVGCVKSCLREPASQPKEPLTC